MIVVDGDNDATFPMFEVLKGKNGMSLRRNGLGRIQTVEPVQSTRGEAAATPSPSTGFATTNGRILPRMAHRPQRPQNTDVGSGHLRNRRNAATNLKVGATLKLGAKATYTGGATSMATTQATFTSLDTAIATVNGNTLTLIKEGTAKVTATIGAVTSGTTTIPVAAAA